MINWGVLSTANIGRAEVMPAILEAKNAKLYAIASGNESVNEIAKEFDIPVVYSTYEKLLDDPEVNAIYIPLPNHLHKEWVLKAAQKGKHVLCEKPAALTSEDLKEMIEACEKNNVIFMEAFMYQFHPQHKRVKEMISSGEIGEIQHIRSSFTFKLNLEDCDNIRLQPHMGGGSLWDVGCYCVHASRYLLEQEPVSLFVHGTMHPFYQVDTNATGVLVFDNGVTASFNSSFEQPMNDYYEVAGTKGTIIAKHAFRPDVSPTGMGEIIVIFENGEKRSELFSGNQYVIQIEHFSECIVQNVKPSYSTFQMLKNILALEACHQSIITGANVKLR